MSNHKIKQGVFVFDKQKEEEYLDQKKHSKIILGNLPPNNEIMDKFYSIIRTTREDLKK